MAASFLVSLTVIPVLSSYFLRPKSKSAQQDGLLLFWMKRGFELGLLRPTLAQPFVIMAFAGFLVAMGVVVYPEMGKNFLPTFREPTSVIATTASPGTSLNKMNQISHTAMDLMKEIPEVKSVSYRAGRAENGDHIVPVSTVEFEVEFHEEMERSRQEVLKDLSAAMKSIPRDFFGDEFASQ